MFDLSEVYTFVRVFMVGMLLQLLKEGYIKAQYPTIIQIKHFHE